MSLVSNLFLLFVLTAVIVYYLVPMRARWVVLLIFSYIYYLAGGARYVFYILFSTLVVYIFALLITRLRDKGVEQKVLRRLVVLGLVLDLGMLAVVKYASWFTGGLKLLFHLRVPELQILFPLGISFYTFQSSGYLLDVYWKKAEAETNVFKFALFVSFFPQLLQGPIGKYELLAPQLIPGNRFKRENIVRGVERMLWGFAKKIIIADWAGIFADAIWGDLDHFGGVALFGLVFYGIQLYADFSGAIDVVIGIGNLFGIEMEENFRQPYLAVSMADFWKRWHITLGRWMMDYVFYPVSLSKWMTKFSKWSRKTFGRKTGRVVPIALADLIVFFLVGIWHGASMKYVMYGLVNGGIIAFSELMTYRYRAWKKALHISGKETWWHVFMIVRTFIIVNLRWFYDRSEDLAQGNYMVKQAFTHFNPSLIFEIPAGSKGVEFVPYALLIIAVGCIIMVTLGVFVENGVDVRGKIASLPLPVHVAIYLALFVMIGLFGCTGAPKGFIYAQF